MCDGTGEEESGEEDEEGDPLMVSCVDCEGTGEVANDCDWCGGSGYESETVYRILCLKNGEMFMSLRIKILNVHPQ